MLLTTQPSRSNVQLVLPLSMIYNLYCLSSDNIVLVQIIVIVIICGPTHMIVLSVMTKCGGLPKLSILRAVFRQLPVRRRIRKNENCTKPVDRCQMTTSDF